MTTTPHLTATDLAALGVAVAWALVASVVDIRTRRIPWWLAASGAVPVAAVLAAFWHPAAAAAGAAALTLVYFVLRLFSPHSLGGGDLRLAPTCGALAGITGADGWVAAAAGAFVLTAGAGIAMTAGLGATRSERRREVAPGRSTVPHGPGMSLCAVAILVLWALGVA